MARLMAYHIGRLYITTWCISTTGIGMYMLMAITPMPFQPGVTPGIMIIDTIMAITTPGDGAFL